MKTQLTPSHGYHRTNLSSLTRIAALVALVALIGIPLFSSSSASSSHQRLGVGTASTPTAVSVSDRVLPKRESFRISDSLFKSNFPPSSPLSLLVPQGPGESIVTYESTCTTPQTSFNLGDTVCAKIAGAPLPVDGRAARRIGWVSPYGSLAQGADITTDPQDGTYLIPTSQTQTFTDAGGGTVVVDNRGTWSVNTYATSDGSLRTSAYFTVHDPATPYVDLSVGQSVSETNSTVDAGSSSAFSIIVSNRGPDAGQNVVLTGAVPNNSTFVAIAQTSGPTFSCSAPLVGGIGTITCSIASLARGDTATFDLAYNVDAGTSAGTVITNNATISSDTAELVSNDNSSTRSVTVRSGGGGGTGTCSVACPDDITTPANTVDQNNNPGAIVHFSPPTGNTECGTIVVDHCNDCFFPVGTTVVTGTGVGDSCSFTVTITPAGSSPRISCPANKTGTADNDCSASINVGTATATGTNVTVVGFRSDGKPMYTCDDFGNCTRNSSDAPFGAGATTINWLAYSHDIPGPYTAQTGDEESHRTGSATCSQTITVDDVTPPVITAQDETVAADANCQAAVPDYTNQVSDNCSCAANDNSEDCVGQHVITLTQSVPAGTLLGPGAHAIHLTANDGSSNNNGAGNTTQKDITFTVADQTAPMITCPTNIVTSTDPGSCSATVNPGTATATDNCDSTPTIAGTRSDNQPLNAPYPKGTTIITWSATDDAGNTSSCNQSVTVNDTEAPSISCPANITKNNDPGVCGAVVTYTTPVGSDNCPGATTAQTAGLPSGSTFPVGTTTNTFEVTDTSGNKTSCSFTVTVNDTENPTITCPADIIADFNPAVNGAVVTYTAPVGTDNCTATTMQTAGLLSGATFPVGTTTNTFRVTDGAGLTATCSFKVTVALTSIIGLDSVSITGAAIVDSYDSTGGYPATKGSLANILSNGTITVAGSSKVFGNVRSTRAGVVVSGASQVTGNATAGTTVTKGFSAIIGGTITNNALAPVMMLPSVPACGPPYSPNSGISGTYSYNSSTGDLSLSGVNIATLANGTYCFHNVTLTNSAQLKVNGLVVIRMTGTLNASGATSLTNTTGIPGNLRILSSYSGSNGVTFSNATNAHLVIYAPNTGVTVSGAAPLFGTVVGKTVTISNSGMIHYDTRLKTIWPDIWTLIFGP